MTVVAISASYGAGGSQIGPTLAEHLGVPFLDRAIPARVAGELDVPLDDAISHDERTSASWIERMLAGFIGLDNGPAPLPADAVSSDDVRRATERLLREQAATGEGVILGRASVLVLRAEPDVLRVRLDGGRPSCGFVRRWSWWASAGRPPSGAAARSTRRTPPTASTSTGLGSPIRRCIT